MINAADKTICCADNFTILRQKAMNHTFSRTLSINVRREREREEELKSWFS